ncbi:DUF1843 domain-containing protein [Tistrella mobilis]|uniref:DUF1843 domain-containing protein n=1 Tax=Tistrella mobilis TaxID=171437 RepID=UPI003557CE82
MVEKTSEGAAAMVSALYGPSVRAAIVSNDLEVLNATLAAAEAQNRQQGDIRAALAMARAALAGLKRG